MKEPPKPRIVLDPGPDPRDMTEDFFSHEIDPARECDAYEMLRYLIGVSRQRVMRSGNVLRFRTKTKREAKDVDD